LAKHRGGRLYEFLTFLCYQPKDVGLIAREMGIERRNVHRLIAEAENFNLQFSKQYDKGRLVTIAVEEESLNLLETAVRILEPRTNHAGGHLKKLPTYSS